ncbi:Agmatine coumaroyltransferase-2 [Phytophthora cinnamomi]|uniref:Agmatine coumaroyltransferase-2 n=1 Tax=Phytophthora cinnamomi TaxID=4785 RepID=UPI003559AC97|nr:Agmatine coumaroyltransferase-2 [Phytophthora cinnamomi]
MAESVVLKLSYAGETHRVTVPLRSEDLKARVLSYELVLDTVRELFPRLAGRGWTLVYRDEEGDVVTLSHALEFDEACHVLLAMGEAGQPRTLHFCVLARVSFRDKVVAPVLQKVVELARLAREATTSLRKSELLEKGRDSLVRLAGGAVSHAGAAINHIRNSEVLERGRGSLLSARSGVSTRLRRASSAVAAGIERRRSASGSGYDRVDAFDPTEFVKPSPVAPPSSEVAVTVDLRQSVSSVVSESTSLLAHEVDSSDEEPPALVPADAEEQQRAPETAYESDADTLCDEDEDREWDVVNNSAEEAIAETDSHWAQQLELLRGIMVHLDEELCCDLLERYNGDVEAVLVELTNM